MNDKQIGRQSWPDNRQPRTAGYFRIETGRELRIMGRIFISIGAIVLCGLSAQPVAAEPILQMPAVRRNAIRENSGRNTTSNGLSTSSKLLPQQTLADENQPHRSIVLSEAYLAATVSAHYNSMRNGAVRKHTIDYSRRQGSISEIPGVVPVDVRHRDEQDSPLRMRFELYSPRVDDLGTHSAFAR